MSYTRTDILTKSGGWVGLFSAKRAVLAAVCGTMAGVSVYIAVPSIFAAIGIAVAMVIAVLGMGASLSRLATTVAALHAQVANLTSARQDDTSTFTSIKRGVDEIAPVLRHSDKRLSELESKQNNMAAEIEARQAARQQILDDAYLTLRADAAKLIELQSLSQSRMASLEKRVLERLERLVDARDAKVAEDVHNLHAELLQRQDLLLDMTTALRVELANAKDQAANGQKPPDPSRTG